MNSFRLAVSLILSYVAIDAPALRCRAIFDAQMKKIGRLKDYFW
jgi:hypothetical protein